MTQETEGPVVVRLSKDQVSKDSDKRENDDWRKVWIDNVSNRLSIERTEYHVSLLRASSAAYQIIAFGFIDRCQLQTGTGGQSLENLNIEYSYCRRWWIWWNYSSVDRLNWKIVVPFLTTDLQRFLSITLDSLLLLSMLHFFMLYFRTKPLFSTHQILQSKSIFSF